MGGTGKGSGGTDEAIFISRYVCVQILDSNKRNQLLISETGEKTTIKKIGRITRAAIIQFHGADVKILEIARAIAPGMALMIVPGSTITAKTGMRKSSAITSTNPKPIRIPSITNQVRKAFLK